VWKPLVIAVFLGVSIPTAYAQGAPWCLQSDAFEGDRSCSYATFQQCLADRNYLNGLCSKLDISPTEVLAIFWKNVPLVSGVFLVPLATCRLESSG
jgi:Protein of unknown function (DUF3551)